MVKNNRFLLACAVLSAIASVSSAHAEVRTQLSTGVNHSSGDFGGTTDTDLLVVPFAARVSFGSWSVRASIPYISVKGPANVAEILDDHGGSSGGSGSNSSGTSGSGSSGSGSGTGSGSGSGSSDDSVPTFSSNHSASGLGDTALSITYAFDSLANSPLYADVAARVRLPTGDEQKGLGVGTIDYALISELGWDGDLGGTYVAGGRRFLGHSNLYRRVDGWQASVGGWLNASERVTLGASYDWREASTPLGTDPSSVGAYIAWRATKSWRVEFDVGAGLSNSAADITAGITLSWRSAAH